MLTPVGPNSFLHIAFYRTSSIGDVVLATACLDLLRQLPLPIAVTWVGRGPALDLLANAFPEVQTLAIDADERSADWDKLISALRNIQLFIDLQCNLRSHWLGRHLKGIPVYRTDKAQLRRSRLVLEARVRGRRRPLPEIARNIVKYQYQQMCEALYHGLSEHLPIGMHESLSAIAPHPFLPISDQFDSPWRKELRFGAWLGIAPGAAHATKVAPLDLVTEVINKTEQMVLTAEKGSFPLGLVFLGDSKDRETSRQILDRLHWKGPVLNLAGRLSLWESAIALREITCLLSNDSSLSHISEAVDTPTAVLFGPTIESFGFAPRMQESRAFSALTGCRPCSKHGKAPCRYNDKLCFQAISPTAVAEHLSSLIGSNTARFRTRLPHHVEAFKRRTMARLTTSEAFFNENLP